jgi:hypothetical protein
MLDDREVGHLPPCRYYANTRSIVKKGLQGYFTRKDAEPDIERFEELREQVGQLGTASGLPTGCGVGCGEAMFIIRSDRGNCSVCGDEHAEKRQVEDAACRCATAMLIVFIR